MYRKENRMRAINEITLEIHRGDLAKLFNCYAPVRPIIRELLLRHHNLMSPLPLVYKLWGTNPLEERTIRLKEIPGIHLPVVRPSVKFFDINLPQARSLKIDIRGILGSKQEVYSGDSVVVEQFTVPDLGIHVFTLELADGLSVYKEDLELYQTLFEDKKLLNILMEIELFNPYSYNSLDTDLFWFLEAGSVGRPDAMNHFLNALYPRTKYYQEARKNLLKDIAFICSIEDEDKFAPDSKRLYELILMRYAEGRIRGRAILADQLNKALKRHGFQSPSYFINGIDALTVFMLIPTAEGKYQLLAFMNRSKADAVSAVLSSQVSLVAMQNNNFVIDFLLASAIQDGAEFGLNEDELNGINRKLIYPRKPGKSYATQNDADVTGDDGLLSFLRESRWFETELEPGLPVTLAQFSDGGLYNTRNPLQQPREEQELLGLIRQHVADIKHNPRLWAAGKFCEKVENPIIPIVNCADDFSAIVATISLV